MDKVVLIHRMKRGYEMKDTDKKVNKKSNLKIYIIFAVMILASLLGGFLAGRLAAVNKDTLDGINWDHIWWVTADTLPTKASQNRLRSCCRSIFWRSPFVRHHFVCDFLVMC